MPLTNYGKRSIASIEFEKGVAFIAAAYLLKVRAQTEPQEHVVLHLVAQGIEMLIKGALYGRDYETYRPMKRKLGHRLEVGFAAAQKEFSLNPMKPSIEKQLRELSKLFSEHALRYSGLQDIFIAPSSIDI